MKNGNVPRHGHGGGSKGQRAGTMGDCKGGLHKPAEVTSERARDVAQQLAGYAKTNPNPKLAAMHDTESKRLTALADKFDERRS
jgi:hypothetical protein